MNDQLHKLLKAIDYNRFKVLGVLLAVVLVTVVASCQSKTISIKDGMSKVTRQQLKFEIIDAEAGMAEQLAWMEASQLSYNLTFERHNAKIEAGLLDLDKQDKFRADLLQLGGGLAMTAMSGNPISAAAVVSSLLALSGIGVAVGSVADGRRKDNVIAAAKEQ
jgi:hypothetical protein